MKADFRTISFFILLLLVCGIALGVLRDKDVEEARLKVGERKLDLMSTVDEVQLYSGYLRYEFVELTRTGRLLVLAPSLKKSLQQKLSGEWKSATFYLGVPQSEGLISQKEFVAAFEVPEIQSGRTINAWEDEEFKKKLLLLCQGGRSLQQFYVFDRPEGKLLARVEIVTDPPIKFVPIGKTVEGNLSEIVWPGTIDRVFANPVFSVLTNETTQEIKYSGIDLEAFQFDLIRNEEEDRGVFVKRRTATVMGIDLILRELASKELRGRIDPVPMPPTNKSITIPPFKGLNLKSECWGTARFFEVSFPGLENNSMQLVQIEGNLLISPLLTDAEK